MGTDWRDSDPEVEPIVEIYQGYRSNFETLGAPRSPAAKGVGQFLRGLRLERLGEGRSSWACSPAPITFRRTSRTPDFYVDRIDRDAILAAMKARRSFAATDNLFVDVRMGGHFMGESFQGAVAPLEVYVAGTGPIAQVQVIKSNKIVYTAPGSGSEMRFTYTDQEPQAGESYYYVRVEQQNGQLGWSSPIWVENRR